MRTHAIKTYNFDELDGSAQDKALCDHIEFWLDCESEFLYAHNENFKKAVDAAEGMKTPWFTGQYVYEYCKQDIIDEIKINEYEFYSDGEIFNFKGIG